MAFLSEANQQIAQPIELSLFTPPPNQVAIEKEYYIECRPISSIATDSSPVEILVSGQGAEYMNLSKSRLYVKAKIVKSDGTPLAKDEKTGIINMPLQTMWSQIDIYMNGKLVSLNTTNYPYKAYMKTILHDAKQRQGSALQAQLFEKDVPPMDSGDPVGQVNTGLIWRYVYTKESHSFDMEGILLEDVFGLDKYLINGIDLFVKLYRANPQFTLMSSEASPDYKIILEDVVFKSCKVKVDPGIIMSHAQQIERQPVQYYIDRTEVKINSISANSNEFLWDNVFQNSRPEKVILAFALQTAVSGSYSRNPFNFQHFDLSELALYVDGESRPSRPMKLDYGENKNFVSAFAALFQGSLGRDSQSDLNINRSDFVNGYSIYSFSLDTDDFEGERYVNLIKRGNTRIEAKFRTPPQETISCIAFAQFPAVLEVDKNREIRYVMP